MSKYLYTSDLRISDLSNRVAWAAQTELSGEQITDKSELNNVATLRFYFNLYEGTQICIDASQKPLIAIRNYIQKFQFPNTRTQESFNDSLSEKMLFAPYRVIVTLLHEMAQKDLKGESFLTQYEILYFLFCNPLVYQNPIVNYSQLIKQIESSREKNISYKDFVSKHLQWNQHERQSREMINVLVHASKCFKLKSGILSFSTANLSLSDEKDFIDSVLNHKYMWVPSDPTNFKLSQIEYTNYMDTANIPYNVVELTQQKNVSSLTPLDPSQCIKYIEIITAAKTKPFILLAGISGTGKSRIVRELARACWDEASEEYKAQKPQNFEMIQVKPNWHDSTELLGYVSRVSGKPVYVVGDFLRFITKAWENIDVPHFLCLDEMNLAPVEQYFAEYLSVVESRKLRDDKVVTDAILKKCSEQWFFDLTAQLTEDEELRNQFNNEGIALPPNLIVVGTVNMDETTFSFSRKVLDRAMTIEMNEVDLWGGLDSKYERIGKLSGDMLIGKAVEGVDVYADNKEVCDIALEYLKSVNEILDKTPFKVAYRTRNEFLLYVVNNLPYTIGEDGTEYSRENVIATALDEITSMKVLSRIEGDDTKVPKTLLTGLKHCIEVQLLKITGEDDKIESVSIAKLDEMLQRLESGYTSFWS